MANYKTNRKVKNIYLSQDAINAYAELQSSGLRVALFIENFLIELNKNQKINHEK